jgi:hypothetical protein
MEHDCHWERHNEQEVKRLKRLLKRCIKPLDYAATHHLDDGSLNLEAKIDTLIKSIHRALR